MRRVFTKIGSCAAVAMLALAGIQPAQAEQFDGAARRGAADPPAYFEMTDISRRSFIVKIDKEVDIKHARDLVSGADRERPHLLGRIIRRPAPFNPGWSYHFDPATLGFFDVAIEVCDATMTYVEDHLDEAGGAFLPGNLWCPWSSKLVKEVPAP
ncbi:calmodulin-binding protein [Streptosporangium sp. NPDC005286]|uniref:BP74-related protein n=1 Tax=Streptosporangium sp. NPDC005286 TaxID=3154463 RepID=UPI0033B124DC